MTAEQLAAYFVRYVGRRYCNRAHIVRVVPWAYLILRGLERIGAKVRVPQSRYVEATVPSGPTYRLRFRHHLPGSSRGGVEVVEVVRAAPPARWRLRPVGTIVTAEQAERFFMDPWRFFAA